MCYLPTAISIAKKRQKNLVQFKITQTTPEREPGEIDLTNLPEKEFKIKVITMLMDLEKYARAKGASTEGEHRNITISGRT